MTLEQLDFSIKNSKHILIISHINPDGDTLGSMCGLYELIRLNYKKESDMLALSQIPEVYKFLPSINKVQDIKNFDLSREYDLAINVDVASMDRCAEAQILFNKAKNNINIDHHETNTNYANINLINSQSSATAELIVDIIKNLSWKVNKNVATCLYTGIMTDTGCFKFSNTTQHTFANAGEMLSLGVNSSEIAQRCYESNSKNMVLFQCYCINKSKFLYNDKVGYTTVYKKT